MPQRSAGILLFRRRPDGPEFLLVHPGGPFFRNRDLGVWTIPKGEIDPGEDPLTAAVREFREETGVEPAGPFVPLTPIRQKGGKQVLAWAAEGDLDPTAVRSNTFQLEWPPHSGRMQEFPEIDRAAFFPIDEARRRINPAQAALLDELLARSEERE
jgi:predicted NUDIX family NTP pyrophosphohydrolase